MGLDDELIVIKNAMIIDALVLNQTSRINSVFLNKAYSYKAFIKDITQPLELPTPNLTPIKFNAFDKKGMRISKEVKEEYPQVEFINCEIELQDVTSYVDEEKENKMVFY